MAFLGETSTQNIGNSKLAFIYPNGSTNHDEIGVSFQCATPIPMRVPEHCSFQTLKSRMQQTLLLRDDHVVDNIYYRQPSLHASQHYFFTSVPLTNDDDVCRMLRCSDNMSTAGPIEILCAIHRTPDGILNLLQSTIVPTHNALLYYNGKWNIPRRAGCVGYAFTGTNPKRFQIPSACTMERLKAIIKEVAPVGFPPDGIHMSQVVRKLFFRHPHHAQYLTSTIEYGIKELTTDEDVLKIIADSNYWKRYGPIEILAIFSKPNMEMAME